jgi:ATPase family protein associated with various cellular activities (AAA)
MLIVLSGLPGTGKTTIARKLAIELVALYLRIDSIEQSIRGAGRQVEGVGYSVAHAVAEDNLRLGRIVGADCLNPWPLTRSEWRALDSQILDLFAEDSWRRVDTGETRSAPTRCAHHWMAATEIERDVRDTTLGADRSSLLRRVLLGGLLLTGGGRRLRGGRGARSHEAARHAVVRRQSARSAGGWVSGGDDDDRLDCCVRGSCVARDANRPCRRAARLAP